MFQSVTDQLVTREHLDRRLLELSEHVDAVLQSGLQRQKRDILAWMVAALAPLYVVVIYIAFKIGA